MGEQLTGACCRAWAGSGEVPAHFHVYVIELAGKDGKPTSPPTVYVGQTAHTPAERFSKHKAGIRAARSVRQKGLWLRPRLFAGWNPLLTRAESEDAEIRLAERLRERGFVVKGGH